MGLVLEAQYIFIWFWYKWSNFFIQIHNNYEPADELPWKPYCVPRYLFLLNEHCTRLYPNFSFDCEMSEKVGINKWGMGGEKYIIFMN